MAGRRKSIKSEEAYDFDPTRPVAYRCECGLTVPTEAELKEHETGCSLSNRPKNFTCPECGKGFFKRSQLRIHLRTHTGERPFACLYCQMTFKKNHHAKRHMRQVHKMEPPPLQRGRSSAKYDPPAPLDPFNHYEGRSRVYEDSFPPMPKELPVTEEIDLQDTVPEISKACPICSLQFTRKVGSSEPEEQIRQHMRLAHQFDWNFVPPSEKAGPVKTCKLQDSEHDQARSGLENTTAVPLSYNPSASVGEGKFACHHCGRVFTNSESVLRHQNKCTAQTPEPPLPSISVTCFECEQAFPNAQMLSFHTAEHTSDRLNAVARPCTEQRYPPVRSSYNTGTIPARMEELAKWAQGQFLGEPHLVGTPYVPPPDKFFTCPKCNRPFNRKDNCNTHMKKCIGEAPPNQPASGEQIYTCEDCGREFQGQFHMYGHRGMHARERRDRELHLRTLSR